MAFSRERKNEVLKEYAEWINRSRALILAEYKGLSMSDINTIRARLREAGGEFHVVKNTLGRRAFEDAGLHVPDDYFEGSTAVGFAFDDAPAVAKAITEYMRTSEFLKIKGGYLGKEAMSANQVKSLAELPPLPVMRAQLLGVLMAPASKLARTLAEPARQVAAVLKAFSEREAAQESVTS